MVSMNYVNRRKTRVLILTFLLVLAFAAAALNFARIKPCLQTAAEIFTPPKTAAVSQTVVSSAPAKTTLKNLTVCFIDVGQGDSCLIYCDGATMLIDAGVPEMGPRVVQYLKGLGIARLDYVVGTHPDADHIGGVSDILNNFPVQHLLMTHAYSTTDTFLTLIKTIEAKHLTITAPSVGGTFSLGGAKCTVIAPNAVYDDTNDMSIVIRLVYKNRTFLFTGDASSASETDILKKGRPVKADVLKVGHHGSASATSNAFLKAVGPKYAVISVGAGNHYGLPAASTIKKLTSCGAKFLRTDQNGTVVFQSDGDSLTYSCEK